MYSDFCNYENIIESRNGDGNLSHLKKSLKALKCLEGEDMYPDGCDWDDWFETDTYNCLGYCYVCESRECICTPLEREYWIGYQFYLECTQDEFFNTARDLNCSLEDIERVADELKDRWERFDKFYLEDVLESVLDWELKPEAWLEARL